MATEIIVLGGVKVIAQTFQAISAMVNNKGFFSLMAIAQTIGIVVCVFKYIQYHDLKVMGKWFILFMLVNTLLLTPKTDIVITDLSDSSAVHKVDNVPVGVAFPFSLVTSIGYEVATFYDNFFHQPNELQYTKTGLLFGARLIDDSFELLPSAPEMNANLGNLTKSCIVPALQLKYNDLSWEKLLQSDDLAKELAKLRSEVLYVSYTKNGSTNYITCTEGVNDFTQALEKEINDNENLSIKAFLSKYFGTNWNKNAITNQAIESVFENYMMSASKSATEIYKQNIYVNALKRSLNHYPASLDGTADLIAITSEQALSKMKLSHLASYRLATEFLPALHTIFLTLLVGIFPIVIMLMFVSELTGKIIVNYLSVLGTLMLWPVLFAIFNSIVNILAANQLGGQTFTLSNLNSIQSSISTLAGAASWVMLSIPFLSMKLFTGLGQQIASAGSYLGNALTSATSADASTTSMGNFNWGNMQMQNINGHKVDLNRSYLAGMSTYQTASGGTITRAEDGSVIAKTNMSQLPMNIDFARMWDSARAKATQEIMRDTETYQKGVRNSVADTIDSAMDFLRTVNNSGSSQSSAVTEVKKAAEDVIRNASSAGHNASTNSHLASSAETSTAYNKDLTVKGGTPGQNLFGFGASASYNVNDSEKESARIDSNDNVSVSIAGSLDKSDAVTKARSVSDSSLSSIQDSDVRAAASAFRDSLRTTHDSFSSFTASQARERAISDTATLTESERLQINENLSSEFVQFVYRKLGHNTETDNILTNAHSAEYRLKREELVGQFETELVNRIKNGYANNMANVSVGQSSSFGNGFDIGGNIHSQNRNREQLDADFENKLKEWEMRQPNVQNVSGVNRNAVNDSINRQDAELRDEYQNRKKIHQDMIDRNVKDNQKRFEDKS